MNFGLKSTILAFLLGGPIALSTALSGFVSLAYVEPDLPQLAQPTLPTVLQLANDLTYDTKVRAGVVPDPALMAVLPQNR